MFFCFPHVVGLQEPFNKLPVRLGTPLSRYDTDDNTKKKICMQDIRFYKIFLVQAPIYRSAVAMYLTMVMSQSEGEDWLVNQIEITTVQSNVLILA